MSKNISDFKENLSVLTKENIETIEILTRAKMKMNFGLNIANV